MYPVAHEDKTGLLLALLGQETVESALVFTRTKHRANRLARSLDERGVACAAIHGNRTQSQRTQALSGFRSGRFRVLVATDIASRGIDVEKLSHVVNFDVPQSAEDYVHRIGRTARAQATGDAWTFVSSAEEGDLRTIERVLGRRIERVKLDGFVPGTSAPMSPGRDADRGARASARGGAASRRSARGVPLGARDVRETPGACAARRSVAAASSPAAHARRARSAAPPDGGAAATALGERCPGVVAALAVRQSTTRPVDGVIHAAAMLAVVQATPTPPAASTRIRPASAPTRSRSIASALVAAASAGAPRATRSSAWCTSVTRMIASPGPVAEPAPRPSSA